ncbi:MAG TPA: hypothetical protein VME70_04815, partial [Mycobacteriales bacterium]|nr:hypothetical protein [Mycobacteriales bacterium]
MTHAMSAPVGAERAEELLAAALAASDADALEVFVAGRTASVLRFAGARVHQPQDLSAVQVMVRAVVGRSAARAATSSVRDVARIVEHACRQARELEKSGGGARAGVTAHQPAAPAVAERGCGLWCE